MIDADKRTVAFCEDDNLPPAIKVVSGLRAYIGGTGLAFKLAQDFKASVLAIGPLSGAYPAASCVAVADSSGVYSRPSKLALIMRLKGIDAVVGTNTAFLETLPEKPLVPQNPDSYERLYTELWTRVKNLWTKEQGDQTNCLPNKPAGLSELLGVCYQASGIYNDLAVAFATLTALGYDYTHEELEDAYEKISDSELES